MPRPRHPKRYDIAQRKWLRDGQHHIITIECDTERQASNTRHYLDTMRRVMKTHPEALDADREAAGNVIIRRRGEIVTVEPLRSEPQ